jgi:CubicO group peptidase (beta-lactamase class C family)
MPDGLPKTSEPEYTGDSIDPHIIKISEAVKEGYISAANERPQQKPLEYIDYTASQAEQTIEAASENEENSREPADTSSCNKYLIKVNRLANCVTVYTYDDYGDYTVPVRAIVCSCGGEKTPLGTFSISDKYTWGFLMGGVWGQYCSRVVQGILFHSVPYSKASPDSVITEEYNKLGTTASHGCIRLPARDAKWIFDNCKAGTEVVIYDDTDPGPLGKPKPIRIPDGCGWDPMDDNLDNPWHRGELTFSIEGALKTEKGQRPDYLRGVCAIDPCGNDISSSVTWSTEVNYMETGSFSVIYSVSDALGSTRLLKRQLTICEAGTLSHYNHDAAQAIVDAAAAEFHTMGLSVAVIENGQVIDSLVNGYAVANSVKMSADTKMRIASISKLGVAIAAAKLYDEGLVKPDEDISTYWGKKIRNPHFPDTPITLRDILCHTSSMTSNDEDYVLGAENTLNQLLSGEVFSWVEPGAQSSYMYNNYAFGVLAVTLELAKNEVLDIYLRDTIFKQLDIEASYSTSTLDSKDLAELYDADWSVTRSIYHMITRPDRSDLGGHIWYYAGNLTISAKDLAKLVTVLINDGRYNNTEILSPEAVAWLEEPQFTVIEDDRYEFIQCLPLRYKSGLYGRDGLYYHTGTAYGVFAIVCYDPDARDGIVVLSTGASTDYDDMGIASVCGSLAESLLNLTK